MIHTYNTYIHTYIHTYSNYRYLRVLKSSIEIRIENTRYLGRRWAYSSVPRWIFDTDGYPARRHNNKWENHVSRFRYARFCYCWKYDGNKTPYCACYETWKDRRIMRTFKQPPDFFIFKYHWTIIALKDDPRETVREAREEEKTKDWSERRTARSRRIRLGYRLSTDTGKFKKGDEGTGQLHSVSHRLSIIEKIA